MNRVPEPQQPDKEATLAVDKSSTRTKVATVVSTLAPWGTIVALGVLILVFSLAKSELFLTTSNLKALLAESAGLGIVAAGLTLCLVSWDFDLSVGAMATLSGIVVALLLEHGNGIVLAIALSILLGVAIGLINGVIVARLNVSAFIGTLGMMTILGGLGNWWSDSKTIAITNQGFLNIAFDEVAGVPLPAIIALVIFVALWVILEKTTYGRRLYAVGANPNAAHIAGIRVRTVRTSAFVGASTLAAVAGLLLASQLSGGYHGAGEPYLLNAYAAVFLGAVTLRLGQFHIVGTFIGILILSVLSNGLAVLSTPSYVTQLATGAILIGAVSLAGVSRVISGRGT
jgi:ribose transport system permease protein